MTPDKIEITDAQGGFNVRLIGSKTIEGYESTIAGLLATISVQAEKMKSKAAPEALLLKALEEIAKGEGPFSRDELKHAENTITSMVDIADTALANYVLAKHRKGEHESAN